MSFVQLCDGQVPGVKNGLTRRFCMYSDSGGEFRLSLVIFDGIGSCHLL